MICRKCGAPMRAGDVFCQRCGSAAETGIPSGRFCPKCGAQLNGGAEFCSVCGSRAGNGGDTKNRVPMLIILTASVIVIIVVIIFAAYMIYDNSKEKISDVAPAPEKTVTEAASTAVPAPTEEIATEAAAVPPQQYQPTAPPQQYTSSRPDPYNPGLTYKRMNGIYNTALTDDTVYYSISNAIHTFDAQCEAYMNGYGDVPSMLVYGSTAYNQQTNYKKKHPYLTQVYDRIDVINTRQGGGSYYAWVTEVLTQTENGVTKTTTDHWVYRLEQNGDAYYISDYTSDPAY